jgi:3-methylcrotonyl-CoA carboxylase alpha subunit
VKGLRAADGTRFQLGVSQRGGRLRVRVGDEEFSPELTPLGPGSFALRAEGSVRVFHCVRDGDCWHLSWEGRVYRLEDEGEGRPGAARHVAGALEAPMPGRVIKLGVEVDQTVEKGDEILVVEAMKMENALRAPRAGRVTAVHTRVGEMVAPGRALVELDEG